MRVLNAAALVVTGTWKFDRGLGQILHDELHWLDVPDPVFSKQWQFTRVWTAAHRRTCRTNAFRPPVYTAQYFASGF